MKEEIFEKLKDIIVEQLDVNKEDITDESDFVNDLGADSLDIVELVMEIEEVFNIKFSDKDAEKIITISDVLDYIMEKVNM